MRRTYPKLFTARRKRGGHVRVSPLSLPRQVNVFCKGYLKSPVYRQSLLQDLRLAQTEACIPIKKKKRKGTGEQ